VRGAARQRPGVPGPPKPSPASSAALPLARGPAPRLCAGFYLPLGESGVWGRIALCYRLPFPLAPKITSPQERSLPAPPARRAPKSRSRAVPGARVPALFLPVPAWAAAGYSTQKAAGVICSFASAPPPLCAASLLLRFPAAARAHRAHPNPAHRGGETPASRPTLAPASPQRSAGDRWGWHVGGWGWGGGVNLILRGWKRKKSKL